MLNVSLKNIGKKFGSEWVFRKLDFEINAGDKISILGGNGSGKSTLAQIISGFITPNEGEIIFKDGDKKIEPEKINDLISFASPYLQVIEDYTAEEYMEHIGLFKPFVNGLDSKNILDIIELSHTKNKFIKQFSSGMKQRLKLGVAILTDGPLLILDEPLSNIDKAGSAWYKNMISDYTKEKTIVVCSNFNEEEYFFCQKEILIGEFKA